MDAFNRFLALMATVLVTTASPLGCSDNGSQSGADGGDADAAVIDGAVGQDASPGSDAGVDAGGGSDATVEPGTPFSFLVYGDSRAGGSDCSGNQVHISLVAQMEAEPDVSFVVHVGDMVTGYGDTTCFADNGSCTGADDYGSLASIIAPLQSRPAVGGLPASFFPVIGNHEEGSDWYPDPCGGVICDTFDMASLVRHPTPNADPCGQDYPDFAYYQFQLGSVAFFVLRANSDYFDFFECNYPPDGWASCADYCKNGPRGTQRTETCWNVHQWDWLSDGLTAADADPAVRWKVIFLHAPVYTSFDDHTAFTGSADLAELIDQHHVSLVMNGHNHCYERTVPIRAGAQDPTGTTYITTSGGGVEMYDATGDWFTAASSGEHHFVRVDVGAQGFSVQAKGLDGSSLDSFTVP